MCVVISGLYSCSSVDKYRVSIETLSTEWQITAQDASDLSVLASQEISDWKSMYHGMYAELSDTLDDHTMAKVNVLKKACLAHGDVLLEVQEIMDGKIKDIENVGLDIQELMLVLENGEASADIDDKIQSAEGLITSYQSSIQEYRSIIDSTKVSCTETCRDFSLLVMGE
ncbi:hypothetical protein BGP76_18295 [Reichenbachiella sp. MSK19-1]|nr:hypothetical protein BGP76_18295 [Reichenbachiella sp. MSK19-1]